MYRFILILIMLITQVYAQTGSTLPVPTTPTTPTTEVLTPETPVCPTCPKCKSCDRGKTEVHRADSFGTLMVGYQYANNWVPRKSTGSYTQILNREWSLEFEYATSERNVTIAGFDVGELSEDRYTLFGKYYVGNSFHVSFGAFMSELKIKGSGKLQDTLGNKVQETAELEHYGLAAGFGSRWQNSWGLTWGVDWFRVNVPVKDGKIQKRDGDLNNDGEQDVSRNFKILRQFPTFTFLGINIGYTF